MSLRNELEKIYEEYNQSDYVKDNIDKLNAFYDFLVGQCKICAKTHNTLKIKNIENRIKIFELGCSLALNQSALECIGERFRKENIIISYETITFTDNDKFELNLSIDWSLYGTRR